jgi:hypothetical protein
MTSLKNGQIGLQLPHLNIRFIDINAHVWGDINTWRETYCPTLRSSFFPSRWNNPVFYYDEKAPPELSEYLELSDSKQLQEAKSLFHSNRTGDWTYEAEMQKHSKRQAEIMLHTVTSYIANMFDFQNGLLNFLECQTEEKDRLFVHPFANNIGSVHSAIMKIWKQSFMPTNLYASPIAAYHSNVSFGEMEFAQFREKQLKDDVNNFHSKFSSNLEPRFSGIIPDFSFKLNHNDRLVVGFYGKFHKNCGAPNKPFEAFLLCPLLKSKKQCLKAVIFICDSNF